MKLEQDDKYKHPDQQLLCSLQKQLRIQLRTLVQGFEKFIYVDYPLHFNMGDNLILLGTEQWIKEENLNIESRWNIHDFSFPQIEEDICILCHGGGNFGDLYSHQKLREEIVENYPQNRIIFLPQTVYFSKQENANKSFNKLSTHSDLHILLRDKRSSQIVRTEMSNNFEGTIRVCPDMAVFLHPIDEILNFKRKRKYSQLCLLRDDIEKKQTAIADCSCDWCGDWDSIFGHWLLPLKVIRELFRWLSKTLHTQATSFIWTILLTRLLEYCAQEFSQYEKVRTSRLHGHIFSHLLGIDNELIDNSYGKNYSYFHEWCNDSRIAKLEKEPHA